MDLDTTVAIDVNLDNSLISSVSNGEHLKSEQMTDQYGGGNLLVNEISQKSFGDPIPPDDSEQLELINRARMGLLTKNQRYMLHKRLLRQDSKYKQEEQVRSRDRMKQKRSDPNYRDAERSRDRERRRRAREINRDQRARERERDRQYKQRVRQTNLKVVREEIVLNTESIPASCHSETDTISSSRNQTFVQARDEVTSNTAGNELALVSNTRIDSTPSFISDCNYESDGIVLMQEGPQAVIVYAQPT